MIARQQIQVTANPWEISTISDTKKGEDVNLWKKITIREALLSKRLSINLTNEIDEESRQYLFDLIKSLYPRLHAPGTRLERRKEPRSRPQ